MTKEKSLQNLDKFRKGDLIKIKNFRRIGIVVSLKIYATPEYGMEWIELSCFIANKFLIFRQTLGVFLEYCKKEYFRKVKLGEL